MERTMEIEIKMNEESMRMFQEVNLNLKKIVELQERNIELMSRFGKGSLAAVKSGSPIQLERVRDMHEEKLSVALRILTELDYYELGNLERFPYNLLLEDTVYFNAVKNAIAEWLQPNQPDFTSLVNKYKYDLTHLESHLVDFFFHKDVVNLAALVLQRAKTSQDRASTSQPVAEGLQNAEA